MNATGILLCDIIYLPHIAPDFFRILSYIAASQAMENIVTIVGRQTKEIYFNLILTLLNRSMPFKANKERPC